MRKSNITRYSFPFQADPFPKTEEFIRVYDIPKIETEVINDFIQWVISTDNPDVINWRKTGENPELVKQQWNLYKYPRRFGLGK